MTICNITNIYFELLDKLKFDIVLFNETLEDYFVTILSRMVWMNESSKQSINTNSNKQIMTHMIWISYMVETKHGLTKNGIIILNVTCLHKAADLFLHLKLN